LILKEFKKMTENAGNGKAPKTKEVRKPVCGIIMPISSIDGCTPEHWSEVLNILRDVIGEAGFEANLVSDADDSGIIQKRIIQNVYSNDLVVCDVSGKNPNVMFELGMRLAFDKPTIIIKDDKTEYSFDTAVIEHLTYPRDLRFGRIVLFKDGLAKKLQATHEKSKKDPHYSTFLKNFGEYKVAHLNEKELTADRYIIESIDGLRREVSMLRNARYESSSKSASSDMISSNMKKLIRSRVDDYIKESGLISDERNLDSLVDYLILTIPGLDLSRDEIRRLVLHG
jgi:hypothetical protein